MSKQSNNPRVGFLDRRDWIRRAGIAGGVLAVGGMVPKALEACAAPVSHSNVFDVKDYGAKGDGVTDDSAAIDCALAQLALTLPAVGGGVLFFPPGWYLVTKKIQVYQGTNKNIVIRGSGTWSTVIIRSSSYSVGDIFSIDSANGSGAVLIEGLLVENSTGANNTNPSYAVHIKDTSRVILNDVSVRGGYGGIWVENSNWIMFDGVKYELIENQPRIAGCAFTGHVFGTFITNSCFLGNPSNGANDLLYGMLVRGADGIQIANCAFSGKYGISMEAGNGTHVNDIYISNCIVDGATVASVRMTGTANTANNEIFARIRISDSHLNNLPACTSSQDVVQIDGNVDYVQLSNNNINLGRAAGVLILSSASCYGGTKKSIIISDNDISENNLANSAWVNGVTVSAGVTGVLLSNNKIRNRSTSGHQKSAIGLGASVGDFLIEGNDLSGNETSPIFAVSTPVSGIIQGNLGLDDQIPTVASAAMVAAPMNPTFAISGTTSIQTILNGWPGRVIHCYPTGSSLSFTTGGNILRAFNASQFQVVTMTYISDGTNTGWIVR